MLDSYLRTTVVKSGGEDTATLLRSPLAIAIPQPLTFHTPKVGLTREWRRRTVTHVPTPESGDVSLQHYHASPVVLTKIWGGST